MGVLGMVLPGIYPVLVSVNFARPRYDGPDGGKRSGRPGPKETGARQRASREPDGRGQGVPGLGSLRREFAIRSASRTSRHWRKELLQDLHDLLIRKLAGLHGGPPSGRTLTHQLAQFLGVRTDLRLVPQCAHRFQPAVGQEVKLGPGFKKSRAIQKSRDFYR